MKQQDKYVEEWPTSYILYGMDDFGNALLPGYWPWEQYCNRYNFFKDEQNV